MNTDPKKPNPIRAPSHPEQASITNTPTMPTASPQPSEKLLYRLTVCSPVYPTAEITISRASPSDILKLANHLAAARDIWGAATLRVEPTDARAEVEGKGNE